MFKFFFPIFFIFIKNNSRHKFICINISIIKNSNALFLFKFYLFAKFNINVFSIFTVVNKRFQTIKQHSRMSIIFEYAMRVFSTRYFRIRTYFESITCIRSATERFPSLILYSFLYAFNCFAKYFITLNDINILCFENSLGKSTETELKLIGLTSIEPSPSCNLDLSQSFPKMRKFSIYAL